MPDLDKVIREIKLCTSGGPCEGCSHYGHGENLVGCMDELLSDALELLKEQEAKTGHWIDTTKVIGFPRVQCSVCGSGQGAIWMDHCPNCGAKMEWR